MNSSKLKETVERARREVKKLLSKLEAGEINRRRLETGLKEVQSDLKVLDFHLDKHKPE
jgi:hypothetical protein